MNELIPNDVEVIPIPTYVFLFFSINTKSLDISNSHTTWLTPIHLIRTMLYLRADFIENERCIEEQSRSRLPALIRDKHGETLRLRNNASRLLACLPIRDTYSFCIRYGIQQRSKARVQIKSDSSCGHGSLSIRERCVIYFRFLFLFCSNKCQAQYFTCNISTHSTDYTWNWSQLWFHYYWKG